MTITTSKVSRVELSERLRSRAMRHPYRSLDRNLMVEASDELGAMPGTLDTMVYDTDDGSLDAEVVLRWLLQHDVKLLPWQTKRLGINE